MILLLKDTKIKEEYKIIIKKYLRYFSKVEYIDLVNIKWKQLKIIIIEIICLMSY